MCDNSQRRESESKKEGIFLFVQFPMGKAGRREHLSHLLCMHPIPCMVAYMLTQVLLSLVFSSPWVTHWQAGECP